MRHVLHQIDGLKEVERIRSTVLRKYCATVSQIAYLDETNLRWLANHIGYNLDIHREYCLHDSTIELTKVTRLLCAIEEGNASSLTGKKLSEITIKGKSSEANCMHLLCFVFFSCLFINQSKLS